MMNYNCPINASLSELVGKTIKSIDGLERESEAVNITTNCGNVYRFYHSQDCCEVVYLDDFEGDSALLAGALIISAKEVNSENEPPPDGDDVDSYTWTFYEIETTKGEIFMRWLGESNGYYSETVDFVWVNKNN